MEEKRLVSVIIPAYNASAFIEETIQSVLDQTHTNIELIIINDGSTDNTLQIIENLEKQDTRISVISKSNSGVCDTRNTGIKSAKGNFTVFLDADDLWEASFLENCLSVFESNNDIHAIYTKGQFVNEKSEKLDQFIEANTIHSVEDILEWKNGFVATPSCTIYRTPNKDEIQNWDNELSTAADQDYFLRIAAKHAIIAINEVLFYYRVHDNNMHQNITVMERDHISVFHKAEKLNYFNSFWFKNKCYANLYLILAGSWWKDGSNKSRGIYFIFKSLTIYPPMILKIMSKLIK